MKWNRLFLLAAFISLTLLAACSLASDITPPPGYRPPTAAPAAVSGPTYPLVAPDPARGVDIYEQKCTPCHGAAGKGDGPQSGNLPNPAPAIGSSDLSRQSSPSDWYTTITNGRLDRFMPGFSNSLSDSQRWDVLSYVYSLSQSDDLLKQGEEVYNSQCASCHTSGQPASGGTSATDFTDPGETAVLSQADIKAITENGSAPDMPAFSGKIDESGLWAVSAYIQSLGMGRIGGEVAQAEATTVPKPTQTTPPTQPAAGTAPASTAPASTPQPDGTPVPEGTALSEALIGSVSGQVINGSGGEVPAGLVITLHGFDDMNEALTQQVTADADGKYLFTGVEMPANRVFMTTTDFNQATFNSDVAHTTNGAEPLSMDLMIYDTSTDPTGLKIDRMHVLVDFTTPETLQVVEMLIISNPTNNLIVAPNTGEPVITYDLPEGASNLQFQDGALGDRYVETEKGFGDTQPIAPGLAQYQVLFGYTLPYDKKTTISVPAPLPVDAGIVMVPEGGVTVTSDQLTDAGTREADNMTLHVYTASDLAKGSNLEFTLKGSPGATSTGFLDLSDRDGLIIGLGAFGLLLVGLGVWVYLSRVRKQRFAQAGAPPALAGAEDDVDALMDAIIALDDQYRSGGISEEAYRQRRADLKQRLASVIGEEPKAG